MVRISTLALLFMLLTTTCSMIMRNNALMSKMVSQFQGKENKIPRAHRKHEEKRKYSEEDTQPEETSSEHVLSLMQNVLCKNFPSVPCDFIIKDELLKNLIEKSIQQLKHKKLTLERSTSSPNYQLTLFPVINSEELSNFLSVRNTGFFKQKHPKPKKQEKNHWNQENKNKSKTGLLKGRKKIRKFYPHKIKYKDKNDKRDFLDYSDEKLSMSVETTQDRTNTMTKHFTFRGDPADPPVWRIDYMKHGEPNLNMFGYHSDGLKGKIMKTGPNVIVDEKVLEQASRKDVLHPDVYIKKNYPRRSAKDNKSDVLD